MTTIDKYFNEDNLKLAYYRVVCWSERLVKDRFGINAFGDNLELNCRNLSDKLRSGGYTPQKGFKFYVPKSSGTQRTKTLLFIEDAIVYQAIANVIASKVYPQLSETEDFVYGSVLAPEVAKGIEIFKEQNQNFFFFKSNYSNNLNYNFILCRRSIVGAPTGTTFLILYYISYNMFLNLRFNIKLCVNVNF